MQKFNNSTLREYVSKNATKQSLDRAFDSKLLNIKVNKNQILAVVQGTMPYLVTIKFEPGKIISSSCTCPYDYAGICKHTVLALFHADLQHDFDSKGLRVEDEVIQEEAINQKFQTTSPNFKTPSKSDFIFENFTFEELNNEFIKFFSAPNLNYSKKHECTCIDISLNRGVFQHTSSHWDRHQVIAIFEPETKNLKLTCNCPKMKQRMCEHQSGFMHILMVNEEIRMHFDKILRYREMLPFAKDFGLENEEFDDFFELETDYHGLRIVLKRKDLLAVNEHTSRILNEKFLPEKVELKKELSSKKETQKGLVLCETRYERNFHIYFFEASLTKEGKIKNPLRQLDTLHEMDELEDIHEIKFLTAINYFQERYDDPYTVKEKISAIKKIVKNPLNYPFYYHDLKISDNITVQSIKETNIKLDSTAYISFKVNESDNFYEISAYYNLVDKRYNFRVIKLKFAFFFQIEGNLYPIENPYYLKLYSFFKESNYKITIHQSKFEDFKLKYLDPVEDKVEINYTFIKPATKKQIEQKGFHNEAIKKIYLEESEGYILLTPAVNYGPIEIPILSQKQINDVDENGNWFSLDRSHSMENNFAGLLSRLHPSFEDQLGQFNYFYLHKREFLDSGWFLDAFEVWKNHEIEILGFNTIKHNNLNPNKIKVSVLVSSGIDWFDTSLNIKFGNEDVNLKQVQKALKNQSRFIQLGDGTQGVLPEEWIDKFSRFFRSGEIVDGNIRTSKINFSVIDELYEKEVLSNEVSEEISFLNSKIASFKTIQEVKVPKKLKATLRDYQKQGLNWLNFLDEFNFGGCLADDMGLGKTVQIIAFILSQKEKNKNAVHLIVVPTSLIFNWEREIEKFAPSLKLLKNYGQNRIKSVKEFEKIDVVITSYGTLISDIKVLKSYRFEYIILDESQAIKNPDSQRFKSVCLLQARNKIVLTGTPIENNTFDLFSQMTFVNPGLFINQNRFKEEYAIPIDKFKDSKRAKELQQKINPFMLRRTKKQVAKELPEKTEMVLYCEMDSEQEKVYNIYKNNIRDMLTNPHSDVALENKSMLVLKGLTKLRQICNSPQLLSDEEDYGKSSAKMNVLLEEITEKSKNHKILIFSQFVGMLDLIRIELDKLEISHEYLTGQTKNREEKVHSFQNDNEIRVFLISLKAGGTGLNLTEADYVYLVDPWWNPAVENQAIDRCYRIGQKKNVVAVRLITPNTIEDKIMQLQENKRELAEDLIKTDTSILKSLSQKDLLGLFS